MIEMWGWYLFTGLTAGTVSSLLGIGSGVLLVPLLGMVFGFAQKSAQGLSLIVMIPIVAVGALRYRLNPHVEVDMAVAGWLAVGGVAGAFLGSQVAFILHPVLLKRLFAIFLIVLGVNMLLQAGKPAAVPPESGQVSSENP